MTDLTPNPAALFVNQQRAALREKSQRIADVHAREQQEIARAAQHAAMIAKPVQVTRIGPRDAMIGPGKR